MPRMEIRAVGEGAHDNIIRKKEGISERAEGRGTKAFLLRQ